jgi:DivIVA domain-containing protein
MDNTSAPQSILDTLRTVEFRLGLKGYNVDEVDEYLEKAAVEAESVKDQLRSLTDRLRQANDRISQLESELDQLPAERAQDREGDLAGAVAPAGDETLQRTLVLAQKFVDQIKRESEAEAAQVLAKAEERARVTVAQAEEHARRVTAEADQRLRDEVARLESVRTRLVSEVDAMSTHLEQQRARIRESLTDALRWFDEHVEPPSAPQRPAEKARAADRAADGGAQGGEREPMARVAHGGTSGAGSSEVGSSTQLMPAAGAAATQSMPVVPVSPPPDATQVLPVTPPASDRAPAMAPYADGGTTGSLFENGHRGD